jgi:hypothetical protein
LARRIALPYSSGGRKRHLLGRPLAGLIALGIVPE